MAKCRSSTPVRNKEQKIDRLLSFMFLRGRRRGSSVSSLSAFLLRLLHLLPLPPQLLPPSLPLAFCSSILVLRTVDVFPSPSASLFLVATYNKTNRGNSARRAMGKEPRSMQKNAKGAGKRGRQARSRREGQEDRGANERHVYAKKEQESGSVDGIAFVVCYRSFGFFGWE